jgi:Uma2 family endonuclease
MMSPAGSRHGAVAMQIGEHMSRFVKHHALGMVFAAETGFIIHRNPDTVRAPDVSFVRAERLADGIPIGFFAGAPDLAVEVVSPDDRPVELAAKVAGWLAAGSTAVWVVDPGKRTATVHCVDGEIDRLSAGDTLADGTVLPGFIMPLTGFFV